MLKLSQSEGIAGKIKESPDDFVVEEIAKNGTVLKVNQKIMPEALGVQTSPDGKFVVFVMQKRDWNTIQALKVLAKKAGRGIKSTAFAGTKDRASISTQLCSIFGAKAEYVSTLHVKDITINGTWQSDTGVGLGDLLGNRFTVMVKSAEAKQDAIEKILGELNGVFPNYFGEQRFGYRGNNVEVGLAIIKGNFEKAAMDFLVNTTNERNLDSIEAREKLANERDFTAALTYFPQYLKYERMLIEYLAKYPTDYANAIRRLPRQLTLMFVHSVEGQIFNKEVESRLGGSGVELAEDDIYCPADSYGFPDMSKIRSVRDGKPEGRCFPVGNIIGYDSQSVNDREQKILEEMELTKEMFKTARMPELGCKGNYRVLFAPFVDFSSRIESTNAVLSFSLPSGSYATVLLDEFVQNK